MDPIDVSDLMSNGDDRVQGSNSILKDHGNVSSSQTLHGPFAQSQQVLTLVHDPTACYPGGPG
jgi:hypothetical protein